MGKKSNLLSLSSSKLLWWTNQGKGLETCDLDYSDLPIITISSEEEISEEKSSQVLSLSLPPSNEGLETPLSAVDPQIRRCDKVDPGQDPDLKLVERLSLLLPRLQNTALSVKKDISRLRSKSCDRILKRARRRSGRLTPPNVVHAPMDEDYFKINSTLRRSRRDEEWGLRRRRHAGGYVGTARAKVDCVPSPYDTEALPFKAGDMIRIIRRCPSGIWIGDCGGRTGNFKFINVEEVEEVSSPAHLSLHVSEETDLPDLLARLRLSHHTSRLVLNGWDTVNRLPALTRRDLIYLGIDDLSEQDRLLAAANVFKATKTADTDVGKDVKDQKDVYDDRNLTRMDSGYYDCLRGESSDESSSQKSEEPSSVVDDLSTTPTSSRSKTSPSTSAFKTSRSPSFKTCRTATVRLTSSMVSDSRLSTVNYRNRRPSKNRLQLDANASMNSIQFCQKFADTLNFFETAAVTSESKTAVTPILKRNIPVLAVEPRLSVAESTHLNKSF